MPRLLPGKHHVQVIKASFTESQTKGTMGIQFDFGNDEGTIDCTRWVTPNTVDRVIADLETLGYSRALFDDASNLDRMQDIIMGNECEIVVEDEEYNGKCVPKFKWINAPRSTSRATPGMRDKLHSLLTGKPVGLVSQPRSAQAAYAPHPSGPLTDDDIPF